ncbi:putative pseudouridine-5'-phosphatase [Smittium culicis]|uniref:Putative pseudouridine-5'-phosphatase n=1 Tax=Smittium culicis TaxID=133412 RepID=A0A1R1X485_9FUNG|nr:putative pseudouridine-5'-phosphatase [Smittium culicis]
MADTKIKAVIFDVDGTLLDTEILYSEAIDFVLKDFGTRLTNDVKEEMMGRESLDRTGIEISPQEFISRVDLIKEEVFKKAKLMPGAEKLIRHLHKFKVPISIATSSYRNFFEIKTNSHSELFSLFGKNITCGDDDSITHLKPNPQIYFVARDLLNIPNLKNEECLVFEDAHNGVKSGCNAGMKVIWIPDFRFLNKSNIPDNLHGAHILLGSLLDFKPEEYGLPPYEN